MSKIRVILAEDHTLVRQGIRLLLESHGGFEVVAEVSDGREAVRKTGELRPDVVLMDISMPILNGLNATTQIVKQFPSVKVLALTMHEDQETVRQVLKAGAAGYVVKKSAAKDLFEAIRAISQGEGFFSSSVLRTLLSEYVRTIEDTEQTLSQREAEILQLIAEGYPNREVASLLCISVKTVESHKENIKKKIGARDNVELIKYAITKGLISAK